jgi:hypothetical protein
VLSKESINSESNLLRTTPGNFNVTCSWCGALIRANTDANAEQMCLICHARMLNDFFYRLKKADGGERLEARRRS